MPEAYPASPASPGLAPQAPLESLDVDTRSLLLLGGLGVAAVVLVDVGRSTTQTLLQFVVALVIALALDRVVVAVGRHLRVPRVVAVGVVVGGAGAAGLGIAAVTARALVDQARNGSIDSAAIADELANAPLVGETLRRQGVPDRVQQWLEDLPRQLGSGAYDVPGTLRLVGDMVMSATLVALLVVLLLVEGPRLVAGMRTVVPPQRRELADGIGCGLYVAVGRYAAGSVLLATLAGSAALGIGLALGVPLALAAGLWAFIWNFVPQLGGTVGGAAVVALAATQGIGRAGLAMLLWLLYSQIENRVVQPVVIGRAVRLSALTTMLGALAGAAVAGAVGAVLAVPALAAVAVVREQLRGGRSLP